MSEAVRKALVVGGGIGGLTAAIALARHGIGVEVVEIREKDDRLGVGMLQPANALRALRSIGLLERCLVEGFASDERRYFDARGKELVAHTASRAAGADLPAANCLPRPTLHAILKQSVLGYGVPHALGVKVLALEQRGDRVDVQLSDGRSQSYDLVIGADGIRSQMRSILFGPHASPEFAGYGCWRVTLPRPQALTYHGIYQGINGTKAGLVPLTRDTMYLYLVTNEPGNTRIPPERAWSLLRERLAGYEGPIGEIRDSLGPTHDVVYVPLEEVVLPPPWYRGRVLLIGDAAHASLPHMAQGAAMAVEDAVVITELAASKLAMEERMERFMARRYERCRYVQETSRRAADTQQGAAPEKVLEHQEFLRRNFPKLWQQSELRLAEAI
jgi:2-polyprenyl-6-methoxyphenol hydroxylase-like FAD-dependent oxidoreductase